MVMVGVVLGDLDMGQMKDDFITKSRKQSGIESNFSDIEKSDENGVKGQKLDERHLKIIEIQDFSAVPYTKQDKSQVKRQLLAINQKEEKRLRLELEIEGRKMSLKECDIALRKAVTEVGAIEIANEKEKLALKTIRFMY
ncbi:hypothetical protein RhiirA4_448188 [Rhizophagus irregularis]|uniref:Uncharacterized protein n=1 Tax=Rhizophagus irregularis TaxID=588596 RepID=A0A2I1H7M9_9GLOM|nr:hypothetical protein RhiirA4_448188 [Rhizophagus irregularis]